MRQKRRNWIRGVGIALALTASSVMLAQHVTTNYMPGTDFSKYHTYKWITIKGGGHPNQIVDAEIKQAIDSQMAAKGFSKTDGNADLAVGYQTAVHQQTQWTGFGGWGWGGMETATSSTIDVGTIVVDVYDSGTKQLIWTGRATKTLDPSKSPEKNQKHLDKAIAKLMKPFPPKGK